MIGDKEIRSITGPSIAEEDALTQPLSDVEFLCAMEELSRTEPVLAAQLRQRHRAAGQALMQADRARLDAIADRDSAQRVLVRQIEKSAAVKRELAEAVALLQIAFRAPSVEWLQKVEDFVARHKQPEVKHT